MVISASTTVASATPPSHRRLGDVTLYAGTIASPLRRRQLLLAGLGIAAGLAGCGGGGDESIEAADYRSATLRNVGPGDLRFELAINSQALFARDADILAAVTTAMQLETGAVPPHPVRHFALTLWRFLIANRYHHDPLTPWTWAHSPALFINSVGFGYCDDVSSAFVALARTAGHPARVWTLDGHVVPEIWIDGRWEMYDADLGVYYLDALGLPCGVEALAADPSLIMSPYVATPPPWATEVIALGGRVPAADNRYSPYVANIYATADDNLVSLWYDDIPYALPAGPPVCMPAGASITLGLRASPFVVTCYGQPLARQGALQLTLTAGRAAVIDMPLVPLDIAGTGTVRIDGVDYPVGGEALRSRLLGFEEPVVAIEVVQSHSPLTIEYLLNDTRFQLQTIRRVDVSPALATAMTVTYSERAPG